MDREVDARKGVGDDGRGNPATPWAQLSRCSCFLSCTTSEAALSRKILLPTRPPSARLKGELSSVRVITRVVNAPPCPFLAVPIHLCGCRCQGSIASKAE